MRDPRIDMIPVEEGFKFAAVNVRTRLPATVGWYLMATNALPNACGKLWFDGKQFEMNVRAYAFSDMLAHGKDLFWLELIQDGK